MLGFEKAKGQEHALEMPDELTVAHMWKGARREYAFDTVYTADTTQAQVRAADGGGIHSFLHCGERRHRDRAAFDLDI